MDTEEDILRKYRTIAVVGLSPEPDRPSYGVAAYLKDHWCRIIPVTPRQKEVLGDKAYPDLRSVPEPVEVVQIFRRPRRAR